MALPGSDSGKVLSSPALGYFIVGVLLVATLYEFSPRWAGYLLVLIALGFAVGPGAKLIMGQGG